MACIIGLVDLKKTFQKWSDPPEPKEERKLDNLHTATLIIPGRDNDGSDNSAVIERTIRALCDVHGGATAWNASGFWVSPEGRLYEDDVRVIQSAVTKSDANEASLRALAQDILSDTDQGVRLPRRR